MNRVVVIAAAVLLLLKVVPATARDNGEEQAREAFQQGVEKFHEKDYASAVDKFRAAYALSPTWKLQFNIGQCEAALKRYGLALDALETYLVAGGDEISPERVEIVVAEIDRLTRLVGELEIMAPDGCEVFIDGLRRGQTPLPGPLRVAAGIRNVEVRQGTTTVLSQNVKIMGRAKTQVELPLEKKPEADSDQGRDTVPPPASTEVGDTAAPAVAMPESNPNVDSSVHEKPLLLSTGWGIGAAGAAALIASAVTGGLAASKNRDLQNACPGKVCTTSADYELKDQVKALAMATDVLLPVGAVMVATGVVLVLLEKWKEKRTAFGVSPILNADTAGLFVEGRF